MNKTTKTIMPDSIHEINGVIREVSVHSTGTAQLVIEINRDVGEKLLNMQGTRSQQVVISVPERKVWCAMCGSWGNHGSGTCHQLHPEKTS